MLTGHGDLVLRGGHHLPLHYEIMETGRVGRCGRLILDMSELDPAVFGYSMELHCDDGAKIVIAVTSFSDSSASFVGRLIAPAA